MANFPTSVSTNANLYIAVNGLQTTLGVACTNTDTTLTLASTTGFPTTGLVTIDNSEVVSYTGVSGATITGCTRGADGTTAAAHAQGVTVGLTVVAAHHNLLKDEVIAVETALGAGYAQTSTNTANAVVKRDGSGNFSAGTITASLTGNASTATKATNLAGGAAGEVPYQSAVDTTGFSAVGSSGDLLQSAGTGTPTWTTPASANTVSTIVKRDSSGNFSAGTITASLTGHASADVQTAGDTMTGDLTMSNQKAIIFKEPTGTGTTSVTVKAPDTVTSSYTLKLPAAVASAGQILTDAAGNGVLSWSSPGAGTVTSVSGTTNQITSTNPTTTPVLAIANPLTLPGAMTAGGAIAMGSNKITGLANGTASTDAAAFGQIFTGFQAPVQATTTTATSTSSSTYVTTALAATITPTASAHRIKISVSGNLFNNNTTTTAELSVERGSTELSTSSTCFARARPSSSTPTYFPASFIFIDSPATTSATTYTVLLRSTSGSASVSFPQDSSGVVTAVITLEEIV